MPSCKTFSVSKLKEIWLYQVRLVELETMMTGTSTKEQKVLRRKWLRE